VTRLPLLAACLRCDLRRPASWLALATALVAGWWTARGTSDDVAGLAAALLGGALATVAAVGELPRALSGSFAMARVAGPAAGMALAAGLGGSPRAAGVGAVAALVTAGLIERLGSQGFLAAESAGVALAAASLAAAASAVGPTATDWWWGIVPLWWALPVVIAVAWHARRSESPGPWEDRTGAVSQLLTAATMALALVGMAAWLFLQPDRAGWYGMLAAGCLLATALPQAALGLGHAGDAGRHRLLRSAAGPARVGRRPSLGPLWPVWTAAATPTAVLAWPPLVAAALAGDSTLAVDRLGIASAICGGGAGLAIVVAATLAWGGSRETAQALAVGLCLTVAVVLFAGFSGQSPLELRWSGVEETGGTCETPHPPESLASAPGRIALSF
jgi:hypothetical protein